MVRPLQSPDSGFLESVWDYTGNQQRLRQTKSLVNSGLGWRFYGFFGQSYNHYHYCQSISHVPRIWNNQPKLCARLPMRAASLEITLNHSPYFTWLLQFVCTQLIKTFAKVLNFYQNFCRELAFIVSCWIYCICGQFDRAHIQFRVA